MRRLSRSEFDCLSTFLLNLYACRNDEVFVERDSGKTEIQLADAEQCRPSDSGKLSAKRSGGQSSSRPIPLSRSKQGCSVDQQAVLALLRPHLAKALQNARGMSRLRRESVLLAMGIEAVGLAAMRIDASGQILEPEPPAARLLSDYCALGRDQRLPETMHEWFVAHVSASRHKKEEISDSPRSLTLENDRGELTIRLVHGEGMWWLLLHERRNENVQKKLREAGLTVREVDVLLWVSKGKTNNEVAAILGAQPATIKKHLKRIYVKLGTGSRVAAASYARVLTSTS
jgi:DNA-binding CsgD family transcriptional regulator